LYVDAVPTIEASCAARLVAEDGSDRAKETNRKKPKGDGETVVFDQGLFRSFKPDSSLTTNYEAKEGKRLPLNAAIRDYVAAGGEITKCKPGKYRKYGPSGPRPPAGSLGTSRENDLSRSHWRLSNLSPADERDLLRGAQSGEKKAAEKLLRHFHKDILKISSTFSGPTHNELVAAGIEGFCYAVAHFDLRRDNGFHAYALRCIKGHVLDYIKEWRRQGIKRDTRADRELFARPGSTAQDIVDAIGCKLRAAEDAINFAGGHESYDTTEVCSEDDRRPVQPDVSADYRRKYSCFDKYSRSPQLRFHAVSDKTTAEEELNWKRLRSRKPTNWNSWTQSADIRNAEMNKHWQKQNWYLDPNFSDAYDYKPEKEMTHVGSSRKQATSRAIAPAVVSCGRGSGQ
jgi:DNA-directed RNA polymerase specialized sigma24 family protein